MRTPALMGIAFGDSLRSGDTEHTYIDFNIKQRKASGDVAGWFFSEKGINDKERDPGWDEYFSSNRSTVESLVRESIQNSLDAAAKRKDKARI